MVKFNDAESLPADTVSSGALMPAKYTNPPISKEPTFGFVLYS